MSLTPTQRWKLARVAYEVAAREYRTAVRASGWRPTVLKCKRAFEKADREFTKALESATE
jgi:hypothetical protein